MEYKLGCIKQKDDHRDFLFLSTPAPLPKSASVQSKLKPAYDQKALGSCTANALACLLQNKFNNIMPSRLFIYYNERDMEGTINCDCGASLRDGIKTLNKLGACGESYWPYDIKKFTNKPVDKAYANGLKYKITGYYAVPQREYDIKYAISQGKPVVFGFMVKSSFMDQAVAKSGVYNPKPGEAIMGGHAVVIVGYDDNTQLFTVRNSWGTNWGKQGYFTMPYSEVLDGTVSFDFWVIEK